MLNIASEEQKPLEDFFAAKGLKTRNEMLDDVRLSPPLSPLHLKTNLIQSSALIQAALNDANIDSSEEEVVAPRADRGSADEDDESVDEDFQSEDESDVAEEYDSAHESSGSGSDVEMGEGDEEGPEVDGEADGMNGVEPKRKKVKVGK